MIIAKRRPGDSLFQYDVIDSDSFQRDGDWDVEVLN